MYMLLVVLHVVFAAVGVGSAASSDALFVKSMRDRRISTDQFVLLKAVSKLVMVAILGVLVVGLALLGYQYYVGGTLPLLAAPHFQVKMIAVLAILVNGIVFHRTVFRFLAEYVDQRIPLQEVQDRLKMLALAGSVSATSWFFVLVISVAGPFALSFWLILAAYLLLIGAGAGVAYFVMSKVTEEVDEPQPPYPEKVGKSSTALLVGGIVVMLGGLGILAILGGPF